MTGTGVFKGRRFVTLYTVKVKVTDGSSDVITGNGIMYRGMGRGRASYRIRGLARGGSGFAEVVQGTIVFTSTCTGDLEELKNMKARFETTVDSAGVSRTTVWRTGG